MWKPVIEYNKPVGESAMERSSRKYSEREVKPVIKLFQLLKEQGFDDSEIHQKIVNALECELNRVEEIIYYYKAAREGGQFTVSDDFTICDETLLCLDNPEVYCRRIQYPLWHP